MGGAISTPLRNITTEAQRAQRVGSINRKRNKQLSARFIVTN
jgi:hypothetical protein